MFDYQSDRHCSKTPSARNSASCCLITSQIDTAPKLGWGQAKSITRLITSQIDAAPKRDDYPDYLPSVFDYQSDQHYSKTNSTAYHRLSSLITSQIDTTPKQGRQQDAGVHV